MADVNETLTANMSEAANNATGREAATPQGLMVAYSSLIFMALVPIFFGSFRSVRYKIKQVESGNKVESMSKKDAAMFPLIASCALFGLYIFFKIFSKEYINLLLALYFFFLGVLCLSNLIRPYGFLHYINSTDYYSFLFKEPIIAFAIPVSFPNVPYHIIMTGGKDSDKEELVNIEFDRIDLVCLALSSVMGVWYLLKKHWIANNVFGLAFSLSGVEILHLNSFPIGCILLGGLFIYDIFWVFGTDVMVTVAKSFEAPIKLVFPMDFLDKGIWGKNFAMLGLGDIVIPGIFIALLLRYDCSKAGTNRRPYFYTTFVAYCLGLVFTVFVMHVFKAAQPALLYLVPACIGSSLLVALIKGEITDLFKYEDHPMEMLKTDDKDEKAKEAVVDGEAKKEQ